MCRRCILLNVLTSTKSQTGIYMHHCGIHKHYYAVSQKNCAKLICQNFVKFPPILIIFRRKMRKRLKLCQMQLTQNHTFWSITRQNRSNGLTRAALKNEQKIKNAHTINISPLCGDHAPELIDMPFRVLTPVTDVIISVKFYVDPLRGFWEGAPENVPFPIFFGTTVTTVLHYRGDCD